jgi:signal transduction histidine kinase/DNA-binding response OmpR family regulator
LRDLLYKPEHATLDPDELPEDFRDLGRGLQYFRECILEARALATALSKGNLSVKLPRSDNEMAAPLKALYASLRHLTWQTKQVSEGDYQQRVEFMGEFSNSFNTMIERLARQREDLIVAKTAAEAASESKSVFLANVSHEIRTPLNAILGLSELELREELPERTRNTIEKILNSGSNLLDIVNDVLDISKIESGAGFEIIPAAYSFPGLVNDVSHLNIVRIEPKDIDFRLEIDENIPSKLSGDELRVKQILNNLLSNAFKYTESGSVTFRALCQPRGGDALMTFIVSDTGIGIKKEDIDKIFKEYSQLNSSANRNIEGTGLGLSITKRLVEMMGGMVSVESEYGVGSSFTVSFTQGIVDDAPIGQEIADNLKNLRFMENRRNRSKQLARSYMPYGRVLVVDDVITNLDVIRGLLLPYGLAVDCVSSGVDAVEYIRAATGSSCSKRYDVVFMDHMMPEMDGVEATRIIRGEIDDDYARTVPIIAFTANALSGNREMFLANGFNSFISKPIDIMRLDMELNRWIRDRQSEETLAMYELSAKPADARDSSITPEWPGLAGIDIASGIRRYESEAVYLDILRSYAAHTPKLLDRLSSPSEDSLSDYAISVHGLKGSSYGICADEVGRLAEELEGMAKAGDIASVMARNGTFAQKVQKLLEEIKETLDAAGAHSRESGARAWIPEPDRGLLEKMLDGARGVKTSMMEEALAELERYEYDSEGALVTWLREKMDDLDYAAIENRLGERRAGLIVFLDDA